MATKFPEYIPSLMNLIPTPGATLGGLVVGFAAKEILTTMFSHPLKTPVNWCFPLETKVPEAASPTV
jgi:hypothetical protein